MENHKLKFLFSQFDKYLSSVCPCLDSEPGLWEDEEAGQRSVLRQKRMLKSNLGGPFFALPNGAPS